MPRLFPAGAGMNRPNAYAISLPPTVPRRRGDEPALAIMRELDELCSPQARG